MKSYCVVKLCVYRSNVSSTGVFPAGARSAPEVDENKPTVLFQLQFANGSKIRQKLNEDHTVEDIQRVIEA